MDAQSFLKNFGYIAEAPDGVKWLREMIYYMGITGKLCAQDPAEGNGGILLEEIYKEKNIRIKQVGYKRSPKLESLKETFNFFLPELPNSWVWTRLVDIGEISPKNNAEDDTMASFAPMSKISEKHAVRVLPENRLWGTIKKGYTHFANGDVAVAKITPCFENGKAAIIHDLSNGIGAGTTELHVVRPLPGVEPSFIYIYLRSPYFKLAGVQYMTGTAGQKRLPTEYFATRPFPLPPIAEQKRIVTKVDELMALCDKLEAQQQKRQRIFPVLSRTTHARLVESPTPTNLKAIFDEIGTVSPDDLRNTILSLAVNGKLTTQKKRIGKNEIEKIRGDKAELIAQKVIKREKALYDFAGLDEIKTNIPDEWEWCRINDIASVVRGGSPRPAGDPRFYGGKIPFLKVADITRSKGMMVDGYHYTIKEAGLNKTRLISTRTVLLTNSGATLGVPAICDFETAFNDGIAAFIFLHKLVFDEFLCLYLKSKSRWFLDIASRGQGQPNLNTDIIRATWFPVPPLEEQYRIVTKAKALLTYVDNLEELQNKKNKISQAFAQSSVSAITDTQIKEQEKMKVPKTELVTKLQIGKKPKKADQAPLANFITKHKGMLSAKALWQQSGMKIDAFYQQLKIEMANGWIIEPEKAIMQEVGAR